MFAGVGAQEPLHCPLGGRIMGEVGRGVGYVGAADPDHSGVGGERLAERAKRKQERRERCVRRRRALAPPLHGASLNGVAAGPAERTSRSTERDRSAPPSTSASALFGECGEEGGAPFDGPRVSANGHHAGSAETRDFARRIVGLTIRRDDARSALGQRYGERGADPARAADDDSRGRGQRLRTDAALAERPREQCRVDPDGARPNERVQCSDRGTEVDLE